MSREGGMSWVIACAWTLLGRPVVGTVWLSAGDDTTGDSAKGMIKPLDQPPLLLLVGWPSRWRCSASLTHRLNSSGVQPDSSTSSRYTPGAARAR